MDVNLKKYKVWGFDFDGVLVDSAATKSQAFAESIINTYPHLKDHRKHIEIIYIRTRGTSRRIQFNLVLHEFGEAEPSEKEYEKWSELFSNTYSYADSKIKTFDGVFPFLEILKENSVVTYISSFAPTETLERICEIFGFNNYFNDILGDSNQSFSKGRHHLEYITRKHGVKKDEIIYLADSTYDIRIAKEQGVDGILMKNSDIANVNLDSYLNLEERGLEILTVKSFKELIDKY